MIIKWIRQRGDNSKARQADDAAGHGRHANGQLLDVAHQAMAENAAGDKAVLEELIRQGWPHVRREQFKGKVRKKVWDVVGDDLGPDGRQMVEEITERLADAAEADVYYKKMFGDDDE